MSVTIRPGKPGAFEETICPGELGAFGAVESGPCWWYSSTEPYRQAGASMSQPTTDLIGQDLSQGRYHVAAKLGEGGMGAVYRAVDTNLREDVVIKVPHPLLLADPQFAARFAREIRSLVKLRHSHIVPIRDVGEQDGLPFAVMEFLSGGNLDDRRPLDATGRPLAAPPEELANWLPDVAKTLDFMHAEGYVHRDVKPGNILFDRHGTVYLGDFGIIKALQPAGCVQTTRALTGTGLVLGTADYMAPELCDGRPFDGRVDQYALAATVYEYLTGQAPFSATTPLAVLVRQMHDKPRLMHEVNPSIPQGISQAVDRALSKSPEDRYGSCGQFARAVLAAAERRETGPVSVAETTAQTPPPLPPVPASPRRVEPAVSAAVVGPVPAGIPWSYWLAGGAAGVSILAVLALLVVVGLRDWGVSTAEGPLPPAPVVLDDVPVPAVPADHPNGSAPSAPQRPSLAVAPFDAAAGKRHQQAWASYLGQPIELTNSIGMKLVLIPPGEFLMGSPASEAERDSDETQHRVRITKPIYVGMYEVTQAEYERVMGTNPSRFKTVGGRRRAAFRWSRFLGRMRWSSAGSYPRCRVN